MLTCDCDCGCEHLTVDQFLDLLEAQIGEVDDLGRRIAPLQHPATIAVPHLKLICSWCNQTLEEGGPGAETSHVLCATCEARVS